VVLNVEELEPSCMALVTVPLNVEKRLLLTTEERVASANESGESFIDGDEPADGAEWIADSNKSADVDELLGDKRPVDDGLIDE
jgi:hypothetical protein